MCARIERAYWGWGEGGGIRGLQVNWDSSSAPKRVSGPGESFNSNHPLTSFALHSC